MRKRHLASLILAAGLFGVVGSVARGAEATAPGYQPRVDSDEAGLWLEADRFEGALKESPQFVQDQGLNDYLKGLVCGLAGPQCGSVRVLAIETPEANAFCLPNGTMVVQTGLLLRMENGAQLAFVLGHELTHYLKRHNIAHYQSERSIATIRSFLFLPFGLLANLPNLAANGWLASNDRDQEREADAGGFEAAVGLGYDPRQAAIIWSNVEEEASANPNRSSPWQFLADHPTNKERLAAMRQRAGELEGRIQTGNFASESFHAATGPLRAAWLAQEVDRGEFSESISLFQRLLKTETGSGDLQYYLGESYRRRNGKGDSENALAAYRAAIVATNAPRAALRGLGLVALKAGQKTVARDAFRQYLALVPDASDRTIVEYYLKTIGE
jgi:predicted Zn-dependent protease